MKKLDFSTQVLFILLGSIAAGFILMSLLTVTTVVYPMTMRAEIQNLSECVLEDQYGSLCWSDMGSNKATVHSDKRANILQYCDMILPMCTAQILSDVNLNSTLKLIENEVGETKNGESKVWKVKIIPDEGMYATLQETRIHKDGAEIIFTPKETTFNGAAITIEELSNAGIEIPELDWGKFLVASFTQE